jgi:hypothetical protein
LVANRPRWRRPLIGDRQVIAVTEDSIVTEMPSGARLKFRRLGREHLA